MMTSTNTVRSLEVSECLRQQTLVLALKYNILPDVIDIGLF